MSFSTFWPPLGIGGQVPWDLADFGTQQILGFEGPKGPKMTPKWLESVEKALKASHCELEPPENGLLVQTIFARKGMG